MKKKYTYLIGTYFGKNYKLLNYSKRFRIVKIYSNFSFLCAITSLLNYLSLNFVVLKQ